MSRPWRLIIAGGRDFTDRDRLAELAEAVIMDHVPVVDGAPAEVRVVSGMAKGADTLGREWALASEIPVDEYPAAWDAVDVPGAVVRTNRHGHRYNAAAGHQRNQLMAENADALLALPGGRGTADMVARAQKLGLQVFDHRGGSPQEPALASGSSWRLATEPIDYTGFWGPDQVMLFTGNPVVNRRGGVVMGRGAALTVRDGLPGIDREFARAPGENLRFVQAPGRPEGQQVGWFKVKDHFSNPARPDLIEASARELAALAEQNPGVTYHLNAPGIGNGGLDWEAVEPLLSSLPQNVVIHKLPDRPRSAASRPSSAVDAPSEQSSVSPSPSPPPSPSLAQPLGGRLAEQLQLRLNMDPISAQRGEALLTYGAGAATLLGAIAALNQNDYP